MRSYKKKNWGAWHAIEGMARYGLLCCSSNLFNFVEKTLNFFSFSLDELGFLFIHYAITINISYSLIFLFRFPFVLACVCVNCLIICLLNKCLSYK